MINKYELTSIIDFGIKYKGLTLEEILLEDPKYIQWALDTLDWFNLSDEAYIKCMEIINE